MSVNGCVVVGIEGTHAAGKTTLAHALVAHYRARGVLVNCTGEPARTSPFIEQIVIHNAGAFDLATEVDLFGAQLSATLRAARHHELLICDKTIMNVVAYARLVLPLAINTPAATVVGAMATFCRAWAPGTYDAVLYLPDAYKNPTDPMRAKVNHLQDETATAVRAACVDSGVHLLDVPPGLDVASRVGHVARRVNPLLGIIDD